MQVQIKDMLKYIQAGRYTFKNLDESTINTFKENYNYMRKYKDNFVSAFAVKLAKQHLASKDVEYVRKLRAMKELQRGISFMR